MSFLWNKKLTAQDTADIAKKFFDSIEAGNIEDVYNLFSSDAKIWHNIDEGPSEYVPGDLKMCQTGQVRHEGAYVLTSAGIVPREVTAKTLKFMHKVLSNIEYQERRVESWPTGFVERHLLTGVRKVDGGKVRIPVCIVCEINSDGKITRLDEYFDSAAQNIFKAKEPKAKI